MNKVFTKFSKLELALNALEKIYQKEVTEDRGTIDATIQRFEFTFELFWKFLQEYFRLKGIQLSFPKDVLKQAYEAKIIHTESIWLKMLKDRNLTSYTYDKELADLVFKDIKNYVPIFRETVNYIKTKLLPKLELLTDDNL